MATVTPFLWFDGQAEEAAEFYASVFANSHTVNVARYPEGTRAPAGSVMTVTFEIEGQEFIALNGGPHFKFTEAVSFLVNCDTQEEADELWDKLTADGGEESQCGWLKDKFGLSWQIVPKGLHDLIGDPDPEKARRATEAMMQMRRIDLAEIRRASAGE
jgi:predicted 3-demethylubiquinone-9 3-methyltransferase (glyoxalase superfamily)